MPEKDKTKASGDAATATPAEQGVLRTFTPETAGPAPVPAETGPSEDVPTGLSDRKLKRVLGTLGLSKETTDRLHSELIARNIRSGADARRNANSVVGALNTAQKIDARRIADALGEVDT